MRFPEYINSYTEYMEELQEEIEKAKREADFSRAQYLKDRLVMERDRHEQETINRGYYTAHNTIPLGDLAGIMGMDNLPEHLRQYAFQRNKIGVRMYSDSCTFCTEHVEEGFTCDLCNTYHVVEVLHANMNVPDWVTATPHFCKQAHEYLNLLLGGVINYG